MSSAFKQNTGGSSSEQPSAEEVAQALGGARRAAGGWMALCPAHRDDMASLSITTAADGKLLVYCHAGSVSRLKAGNRKPRRPG